MKNAVVFSLFLVSFSINFLVIPTPIKLNLETLCNEELRYLSVNWICSLPRRLRVLSPVPGEPEQPQNCSKPECGPQSLTVYQQLKLPDKDDKQSAIPQRPSGS